MSLSTEMVDALQGGLPREFGRHLAEGFSSGLDNGTKREVIALFILHANLSSLPGEYEPEKAVGFAFETADAFLAFCAKETKK